MILRNLLSDKQKKWFDNLTFIGLKRVSRMNTIWGTHLHISNGGLLLVNISHMYIYLSVMILWFGYKILKYGCTFLRVTRNILHNLYYLGRSEPRWHSKEVIKKIIHFVNCWINHLTTHRCADDQSGEPLVSHVLKHKGDMIMIAH